LPLSFAQQRLWFIDQLEPGSAAYNIPHAVRLRGVLDVEVLQRTLNEIVRRHEVLRTSFPAENGEPRQEVAGDMEVGVTVVSLRGEGRAEEEARRIAEEEARRPFDLGRGPLLRAKVVEIGEQDYVLLVTMHHVVSDGWSVGVLIREFTTLYEAYKRGQESPLPELKIQYGDYAHWQRGWLKGEVLEREMSYWREQLAGVGVLELPTDHPRPTQPSHRGGCVEFRIGEELTERLKELSRREGVTLFMTLLAAFQVVLGRYAGQEDVAVGTDVANRNRMETEGLIGFFVNQLVLRTDLRGNPSFVELLRRVREVTLGAYTHQDVPFEKVVEELVPARDLGRSPLFQVMMVMQNMPQGGGVIELPELQVGGFGGELDQAKWDIDLIVEEGADGLSGTLRYATDLFEGETIERLGRHLEAVLRGVVREPGQRVGELRLMGEDEWRQVVEEWNATEREYASDRCVHELFEEQVERTPEAVAVVFEDEQLSYGELNRRANQLGHYLRGMGVGPEVRVGLCVERSLEMVIGILGVLKAGGAYVPLDPGYPAERLAYMLEDSQVPVLLTQGSVAEVLGGYRGEKVRLDGEWSKVARSREEKPKDISQGENLAYVIYTSGSTGRPKGVMVSHRNLVSSTQARGFYYREPLSRFFLLASFCVYS
jgi:hypothetical protein